MHHSGGSGEEERSALFGRQAAVDGSFGGGYQLLGIDNSTAAKTDFTTLDPSADHITTINTYTVAPGFSPIRQNLRSSIQTRISSIRNLLLSATVIVDRSIFRRLH